ncbi:MAG: ORF6N domain-containing protein [Deltaproteobacteria bacterium]|nr:ORF6N domain-containing protein [Deltaproteobacteria bacterium]
MNAALPAERIEKHIIVIRGRSVMIDADLADLYGVETKVLVQAVKRNVERFPDDFMFQLTKDEFATLRSQFVTSSWGGSTTTSVPKTGWTSDGTGRSTTPGWRPGYG